MSTSKTLTAIVLAAGRGLRMKAPFPPKSLSPVAGKPMLFRILQVLSRLPLKEVRVVVQPSHRQWVQPVAEAFKARIYTHPYSGEKGQPSPPPTGTASSVKVAMPGLSAGEVLIVNGDHPLLRSRDLQKMIDLFYSKNLDMCLASFEKPDPGSYGRLLRRKGKLAAIVEKDQLSPGMENLREVNAGLYMVKASFLNQCLPHIKNNNPKKEYYLTDMVARAFQQNKSIEAVPVSVESAFGVNTQQELALATRKVFSLKRDQVMSEGVILIDPLNTYIEEDAGVGPGSVIYPGVYLKGQTRVGRCSAIESHCFIRDSQVGDHALVRAGSYLESVVVEDQAQVGPYARLRAGTHIGKSCKVGNFVEMKKTRFGSRSKAGHFSYLGDCEVGEDVNIGCGVVSANLNLNGQKNTTRLGDGVFVGSGTQLVAPVELKEGSATGAGSVIVEDVPRGHLALSRVRQVHRLKKRK